MGYVGITKRSFHGDGLSFHGLGASDDPDVTIDYYASASQLHWRSNSVKTMHAKLKKMDADWHTALANLPLDMIPDEGLRVAARAFASYPLPVASEIAVALEVLWGNRPFDENCVSVLLFARDRLLGSAGAMAAAAGTAGLIAGVMVFVAPADLGISAASVGSIAGTLGAGSAVLAGLGGIIAALARGEAPRKGDLDLMMGGASAMTGTPKPGTGDQQAAIAALAERQDEENASDRATALQSAKASSARKAEACRARGGVFDPKVPGGCRVIDQKRTTEKLRQAGVGVGGTSLVVPVGLTALGVIGIYLLLPKKKPRTNPKRKRRRS